MRPARTGTLAIAICKANEFPARRDRRSWIVAQARPDVDMERCKVRPLQNHSAEQSGGVTDLVVLVVVLIRALTVPAEQRLAGRALGERIHPYAVELFRLWQDFRGWRSP